MKNKLLLIFAVIFLAMALAAAQLEFTHEEAMQKLDWLGRIRIALRDLSTVGQAQGCSQYADSSGIIPTGTSRQIYCSGLIDVYEIDAEGGWHPLGEFRDTVVINTYTRNYGAAWECYKCPPLPTVCTEGQILCASDMKLKECIGNQWYERYCGSNEYCNGYTNRCQSSSTSGTSCIERWTCSEWNECSALGKQARTCTDTANCGTTQDKPAETQSCVPTVNTGNINWTLIGIVVIAIIIIIIRFL